MSSEKFLEDLSTLNKLTSVFFEQHWSKNKLGTPPMWKSGWKFEGSIYDNGLGGVYALLNSENKIGYIGVGISNSKYGGLVDRLLSHVIVPSSNNPAVFLCKKTWKNKDVESIATIGFDKEVEYLASALEIYLIRNIKGLFNKVTA